MKSNIPAAKPAPHARSRRRAVALSAAALVTFGATACSASDQSSDTESSSGSGTVNVLVHDSFSLPDELIQQFEDETGYKLVTSSAGDAGVVNQLILTKDNPGVDAAYGVDGYSAYTALDEGVFESYVSSAVPDSAADDVLEDSLNPIDMADVCVNVDHDWFEQNGVEAPTTIADLATAEYAPLLVAQNPSTSATGLAFLIATIADQGTDGFESYWSDLLANGTKVDAGWSDAYYTDFSGADGKGDYPLVVSYSSSPAESAGATGSIEGTCTRQVEYAGVVAGAANEAGAKAFVDFMLSDDVQAALPESMYMYPINTSIELPAEWAQYATLTDAPLTMDLRDVADNREAWIKDWTTVYEAQGN